MPILATWLIARAQSQPLRMEVFFAGASVGESRYERLPNDSFRSSTRFTIGSSLIDTTVEGKMEADRIVRYKAEGSQAGTKLLLEYASHKLTYLANGKRQSIGYTVPPAYAASLHPQFAAKLLAGFTGLAVGEERKASIYLLDVGSEVAISIRAMPQATVRIGNHDETALRFGLTIGPTELEYDVDDGGEVVAMDVPGQRLRFVVKGWEALFADVTHPELSQPTFRTERLRNLRMRTRDGVALVADAVRPAGRGRFPVILERTPYGRDKALALADYWASRGYVYVAQDCRGHGDSDGDWDPFVHEGKDGYDAIAWAARQSWCDGKVGTIGGSYAGTVQWQAAVERPPALCCIVPQVPTPDAMHNLPYEYGTFFLFGSLWWSRIVAEKNADLKGALGALPNPKALATLPLGSIDRVMFGRQNPIFQSWLRRSSLDDWGGFDQLGRMAESNVPALHISGWYDGDGIGTKLAWEAMRRAGRRDQWLVYGPWTHAFNTTTRLGDLDFGSVSRFDLDGLTLRFFDTYLKGQKVGLEETPRVQAFVTGANRWIEMDGWPTSTAALDTLYLTPKTLEAKPSISGAAVWLYDPAKDVDVSDTAAPDGSHVDLPRKGTYVLFKGGVVGKPTAIGGPFEVRLFFKSSAVDTDLFATLVDIDSKGRLRSIGQPGKLRASYRDSLNHPSLLQPGRTYTALLHPWDAAHELGKGHRLGLLVDSSLFPFFARNLGTGEPLATGRKSVKQRNVILTGSITPSRITFRRLW